MESHIITIVPTTNEFILKFESSQFLVRNESYEFKNIDEAKPSPLAQKLFYLPFVKTVYLSQNFVAIERYSIVEWEDVQEQVASQIEEYLNTGLTVITESEMPSKKVPVTVYTESTPNPNVMKFVANKKLVVKTQEFKTIEHTESDTLARGLYNFPFVKEIFVDENYISIQKRDIVEWVAVTNDLRSFIKESIEKGITIGESNYVHVPTITAAQTDVSIAVNEATDDISKQIIDILDEYIKPAVASDGGNIAFDSYNPNSKEVLVILQGACSGCPSSTMTLRNGIETMLKEMIPGKIERVTAING